MTGGGYRLLASRSNFGGLVLGCMDSYDSNQILIFSDFSRSTRLSKRISDFGDFSMPLHRFSRIHNILPNFVEIHRFRSDHSNLL